MARAHDMIQAERLRAYCWCVPFCVLKGAAAACRNELAAANSQLSFNRRRLDFSTSNVRGDNWMISSAIHPHARIHLFPGKGGIQANACSLSTASFIRGGGILIRVRRAQSSAMAPQQFAAGVSWQSSSESLARTKLVDWLEKMWTNAAFERSADVWNIKRVTVHTPPACYSSAMKGRLQA